MKKVNRNYWNKENCTIEARKYKTRLEFQKSCSGGYKYCLRYGIIDEENIVSFIKFMSSHNINDSREINTEMWNQFMEETNHTIEDVRELLEEAGDCINIPDLMDFIDDFDNIILTGGGINECLKEVELALLALNKPYSLLKQYTY
jgi:hypothetical protein